MSKKCCFAGHSKIYNSDEIYIKLLACIENLITKEDVSVFWVGNYGRFDALAAKAVQNLKTKYPHITLELVIPYLTKEIDENKEYYYQSYDHILIADISQNTPKRFYISRCNEYMVDKSDFIICYVKNSWGGASKTLDYAKRKNYIVILNLAY